MTTVFLHNSNVPRGTCSACRDLPASWTLSAQVSLFGQVKSDLCTPCLSHFDIPTWAKTAEARVMQNVTETVEEALREQRL